MHANQALSEYNRLLRNPRLFLTDHVRQKHLWGKGMSCLERGLKNAFSKTPVNGETTSSFFASEKVALDIARELLKHGKNKEKFLKWLEQPFQFCEPTLTLYITFPDAPTSPDEYVPQRGSMISGYVSTDANQVECCLPKAVRAIFTRDYDRDGNERVYVKSFFPDQHYREAGSEPEHIEAAAFLKDSKTFQSLPPAMQAALTIRATNSPHKPEIIAPRGANGTADRLVLRYEGANDGESLDIVVNKKDVTFTHRTPAGVETHSATNLTATDDPDVAWMLENFPFHAKAANTVRMAILSKGLEGLKLDREKLNKLDKLKGATFPASKILAKPPCNAPPNPQSEPEF